MTPTSEVIRLAHEAGLVLMCDMADGYIRDGKYANQLARLISLAKAEALAEGWQHMDSAPKDGTKFDAWDGDVRWTDVFWGIPTYAMRFENDWCVLNNTPHGVEIDRVCGLVRWRPLPPPPKEAP